MKHIPSMVTCVLMLCCPLAKAAPDPAPHAQLLPQCQVPQADINIIGQLSPDAQALIASWKTCSQTAPFTASRDYYRRLKPKTRIPLPPAGWDTAFLTDEEFVRYADIIANAPW